MSSATNTTPIPGTTAWYQWVNSGGPSGGGAPPARPSGSSGGGYTAPYPTPNSTYEWEQNILTNPSYLQQAGSNPVGLNAALIYSILGTREANAASDKDFNNALGVLYRNRDATDNLLSQAGQQSVQDIQRRGAQAGAHLDTNLTSRGLFGTTVRDALQNRNTESTDRSVTAAQRAGAEERAGNMSNYASQIAGLYSQRQRIFNPGIYGNLAAASSQRSGGNSILPSVIGALGGLGAAAIMA